MKKVYVLSSQTGIRVEKEQKQYIITSEGSGDDGELLSMSSTFDVSHDDILPLKDVAPSKIISMLVTLDVFHAPKSPLKEVAFANVAYILFTLVVFHDDMFPLNEIAL